jgi:acyl dehydratase
MTEKATMLAEPYAPLLTGARLRDWPTVVTAERQARYHDAAQVPAGLFGGAADISILANDCILATSYLKTEDVDGLHAGQRMTQHEPVHLDEPLTLVGRVAEQRPTKRGTFTTFAFDFTRPDGSVPLQGELISFRIDAEAMRAGRGAAAPAAALDGFEKVADKQMTPDRTGAYSFEFPGYLVHFDPDAAKSAGLPKPVAQGLLSYTWMMEVVAGDGLPDRLHLDATFRHPVYWDEAVSVWRDGNRIAVVGGDGLLRSTGSFTA